MRRLSSFCVRVQFSVLYFVLLERVSDKRWLILLTVMCTCDFSLSLACFIFSGLLWSDCKQTRPSHISAIRIKLIIFRLFVFAKFIFDRYWSNTATLQSVRMQIWRKAKTLFWNQPQSITTNRLCDTLICLVGDLVVWIQQLMWRPG